LQLFPVFSDLLWLYAIQTVSGLLLGKWHKKKLSDRLDSSRSLEACRVPLIGIGKKAAIFLWKFVELEKMG
jgi:hypothetical protein